MYKCEDLSARQRHVHVSRSQKKKRNQDLTFKCLGVKRILLFYININFDLIIESNIPLIS